jgi:hypothetical protein
MGNEKGIAACNGGGSLIVLLENRVVYLEYGQPKLVPVV